MEEEFRLFLYGYNIDFVQIDDKPMSVFLIKKLAVVLVSLEEFFLFDEPDYLIYGESRIFLYEDKWNEGSDFIKQRLLCHFGLGDTIFARNTRVEEITSDLAAEFLNRNHSYGSAAAKYKYGLFVNRSDKNNIEQDTLVAVATFSTPKIMNREGLKVESYEWIRYASLPKLRVVGGMGKLLKNFIDIVDPQEIMSYSDREWSEGEVYLKLGFVKDSIRKPVEFYVDRLNMLRFSGKKINKDRK